MPAFHLTAAVADAFPDTLIALVTATGLRGHEPWPDTATALTDLEQRLADGSWQPADETDPRIEAWHTAYRSFGTNPRRIRPSVDALGRRLAKRPAAHQPGRRLLQRRLRPARPARRGLRPGPGHRRGRHPPGGRHRVLHPARRTGHHREPEARRDHLRGHHRRPDPPLEPPRRPPHPRHRGLHPRRLRPRNPPRRPRRPSPHRRGRGVAGSARPARRTDRGAPPRPGTAPGHRLSPPGGAGASVAVAGPVRVLPAVGAGEAEEPA